MRNTKKTIWIRAIFTLIIFGIFSQIIYLLFHPTLQLADNFRDLLNIIVGGFLASFSKIIDFSFHSNKKEEQ